MIVLEYDFNSYICLVIRFYIPRNHILITKQLLSTYYVLELLVFTEGTIGELRD